MNNTGKVTQNPDVTEWLNYPAPAYACLQVLTWERINGLLLKPLWVRYSVAAKEILTDTQDKVKNLAAA